MNGTTYIQWLNKPATESLSNSLLVTMTGRSDTNDVCWSPDQTLVASAHRDGSVSVWSSTTGEEIGRITTHKDRVNGVQFSSDGAWLVSVAADGLVAIFQAQSRQLIASFPHSSAALSCDIFQVNGKTSVAVGFDDGTVGIYTGTGRNFSKATSWKAHDGGVTCLSFSPAGRLVTGSADKTLTTWDSSFKQVHKLTGHSKPVKVCRESFDKFSPSLTFCRTAIGRPNLI